MSLYFSVATVNLGLVLNYFVERWQRHTAGQEIWNNNKREYELLGKTLKYVHMSRVVRKPTFCICENKDADQLRGNREADQRLCFRYTGSSIPSSSK